MAQVRDSVTRLRLGNKLRQMRTDAGHTQKKVAEAMEWSESKLIRIEGGSVKVSKTDLGALLAYYGVDSKRADELLAVRRSRGRDDAWWNKYRPQFGQRYTDFLACEAEALRIRQFEGQVVPGLLQTTDYTATLLNGLGLSAEEAERRASVLAQRRELLTRHDRPELLFVLDEAVLRRRVGGPDVMTTQLTALKELASRPHISIRILPFVAGAHRGILGAFTIIDFSVDNEDYVVILEAPRLDVDIRDKSGDKDEYVRIFAELETIACEECEFDEIIDQVIDDIAATRAA